MTQNDPSPATALIRAGSWRFSKGGAFDSLRGQGLRLLHQVMRPQRLKPPIIREALTGRLELCPFTNPVPGVLRIAVP